MNAWKIIEDETWWKNGWNHHNPIVLNVEEKFYVCKLFDSSGGE